MSEADKQLDQEFGIVDTTPEENLKILKKESRKPIVPSDKGMDKEKDYKYARSQLYDIVEKMQESLNDAMDVAHESQHPRAFEVVFNGAKNAADVVEKISDLHKKMRDMEIEEVKVQQHNTTNNVFMSGSTNDLLKMLKESQDK